MTPRAQPYRDLPGKWSRVYQCERLLPCDFSPSLDLTLGERSVDDTPSARSVWLRPYDEAAKRYAAERTEIEEGEAPCCP